MGVHLHAALLLSREWLGTEETMRSPQPRLPCDKRRDMARHALRDAGRLCPTAEGRGDTGSPSYRPRGSDGTLAPDLQTVSCLTIRRCAAPHLQGHCRTQA